MSSPADSGDGLRAAVVDDDTVMRQGLQLLMAPYGMQIQPFADVPALLRAQPDVDVVLLDLDLSRTGSGGVLQGRHAVAAHWPVLIYTNQRRRLVLAACLAAPVHGASRTRRRCWRGCRP